MAIPVRDNGLAGPQKHLVVFVHGFSSSAACWTDFVELLKKDVRFGDYEFRFYGYPTAMMYVGVSTRLPKLRELARGLGGFLKPFFGGRDGDAYIDVTLVGHSMGGLVIQGWLVHELQQGRGADVKQIRQMILLATPNLGSRVVSTMRTLLYWILSNPQEQILRILEPEISEISNEIQKRVVSATDRSDSECPIPVHAFWGERDKVVEEASARGAFPNTSPLPCDHFDIIPKSADCAAYVQISDAILEPEGHHHVYEIDEFRFLIRVEPRAHDFEHPAVHGTKSRPVRTNNVAYIRREAQFSSKNHCKEIFTIKYATRNDGFVKYDVSHTNMAPPDQVATWEDHGSLALFLFRPQPRETFALNLEVYKGFDKGNCDVHHHLNSRCFFRRYVIELDLSMFLEQGHKLVKPPSLCFLRHDPGHDSALCAERNKHNADPHVSLVNGVWRWELDYLKEGILDLRWAFEDSAYPIGVAAGAVPSTV